MYTYMYNTWIDVLSVQCKTEGANVFSWLLLAAKVVNSVLPCGPMYVPCATALAQLLVLPLEGNHGAVVKRESHSAEGFSRGLEGIQKVAAARGCKQAPAVNLEEIL